MKSLEVSARVGAAVAGTGIVGCVAYAAVMASGGFGTTGAPLVIALAIGLIVGSICIGVAWHQQRRSLAFLLALALLAGEAWSLLLTAERTITSREQQQAPLREQQDLRDKAQARVDAADRALANIPTTTERLRRAGAAKVAADAAAIEKSAERGCASNCRQLLQAQVDQAQAEVEAARAELADIRAKAERVLADARADLAALPVPSSSSPLADRLGVKGWQIDLAVAGLASVAANGLAALLLAFAAHGRPRVSQVIDITLQAESEAHRRDPAAEADWFARTTFRPSKNCRVKIADLRQAYHNWCRRQGLDPLPDRDIGQALNNLFSGLSLYRQGTGAEAVIPGIEWRENRELVLLTELEDVESAPRRPLGHMVTIGRA